ncbi:MAG: hypothetical protein RLZZ28_1179 [Bacteroidota bacterium]|jgi:cellulose synthase/poly-beta-1,6-N-acetylglucosamine synthase-like glycosyltransferase
MYWSFLLLTAALLGAYCLLILLYRQWYLRLPLFKRNPATPPLTRFSVIIPARNEADNIVDCLETVLQQAYPPSLFEVILVNDHSTDATESLVAGLQKRYANLQLINLTDHLNGKQLNAYKKKAIEIAIAASKGDWIITTDADCKVKSEWLANYDGFIRQKDPVFVAAPVMFKDRMHFLSHFQSLDFISLQGITAAAVSAGFHSMCNGANIAYKKQVFYEVEGFKGIDELASGDDMLLMHKIRQEYPSRLGYLFSKEAIVETEPMPDWKSFLQQRIRWASKAETYRDKMIFWILALVYAVNAALLILLLVGPFVERGLSNWLILIICKTLVELTLMVPVARFFDSGNLLSWFPLMQPFHIAYTVIAGWLGKFGSYEWKGRNVQ